MPDGLAIVRIEGALFFANAGAVRGRLLGAPSIHAVIVDAESIPDIDVTASETLLELADELTRREVRLWLAHDVGRVRDALRRVDASLNVASTVSEAVAAQRR